MFVSVSLLAIFIRAVLSSVRFSYKVRYESIFVFLLLFFVCFFVSCLSFFGVFESFSDQYFSVFSEDSYRYINEIHMFRDDIYLVDELSGVYKGYEATPKFGLSSLLAFFSSFFGVEEKFSLYFISNFIFVIFSAFNYSIFSRICRSFGVGGYVKLFFLCLFFFFPLDWYWNTRFLREPLANTFFIGGLLSYLGGLVVDRRLFFWTLIYLCLMTLFRAQLALFCMMICTVMAFCQKHKKENGPSLFFYFLSFFVGILSLEQILKSSGVRMINEVFSVFDIGYFRDYFSGYQLHFAKVIFMAVLFFSFLPWVFFRGRTGVVCFNRALLVVMLSMIFVLVFEMESQIRFLYPLFIGFKFIFFVLVLDFFCGRHSGTSRSVAYGRQAVP